MLHFRLVSAGRRVTAPDKAIDPAGAIFLQVWFAVMTFILSGAFGGKD